VDVNFNDFPAECQSKTTGLRPWLELYRRSAAKKQAEYESTS